ncbi:hypothetical protein [Vibrio parahaemolyticus]|uniref:hypothetical protein n=1 Tax=Vibrio parahaemolyticus TaxID=670 RepID=UPI00177BC883|nr:hypothetical protein [Vibrio parahaemolyticus]MBD6946497.1 hypothetical protein [Vibrio parahaemolyticus]MBD6960085.1 hypothetical protein [Vibrio parahaemolyticus]MBD6979242.1 hypothetical protein [Vibrio parahaemolyticus]MBD6992291.1 hypothetical protein [Vibrio parahaemolyticus]
MFKKNRPKTWEEFEKAQKRSSRASWLLVVSGWVISVLALEFSFFPIIPLASWLLVCGAIGVYDTKYHYRDRFLRGGGLNYPQQKLFMLKEFAAHADKDGNL